MAGIRFAATLALACGTTALNNGLGLKPPMGFSTWNHFGGSVSDPLIREVADAMASSGLVAAGYEYLNLDDGWAVGRTTNGTIIPDPKLFPNGMAPLIDYVHSKGLKFGIYTARGSKTCMGRPGSDSHEQQDADTYALWGVDYLKEDSCGGTTHGTVWQQYSVMRDALNATGRPIYFSITQSVPWDDGHQKMHCYGETAFTVLGWLQEGLNPSTLANSYLVEYCNNEDTFGYTDGTPTPGGFLSNLDSQQLLTFDNQTVLGAYNDNDMLEVCNGGQSNAEYRAQFSTWSILSSPLILGNDPRSMDADCLAIVLNDEVIAVNQDPLVSRGKLVYQWPAAVWPNDTVSTPRSPAAEPPLVVADLAMVPCNASDPAQTFVYNASDQTLRTGDGQACVSYLGYHEANTHVTACQSPPWDEPDVGSQRWTQQASDGSIRVVDSPGKVLDVYDCSFASGTVQVCTEGAADCYSTPNGPPGCNMTGQRWDFNASGAPSLLASAVDAYSHCVAVVPQPQSPVDIRLQVWSKPLADGSVAAVAFNRSPLPLPINVTWAMLGVPPSTRLSLRDLWQHADLGVFSSQWSGTVQPHDVVMLRATPAGGK